MIKKILIGIGILILICAAVAGTFYAIYIRPVMKELKTVKTIPYDDKLTLVLGGGGNSGILVSDEMVLVIDTKMDEAAEQFANQAKALAKGKPIFVINTHIHSDHVGGNSFFRGQIILAGNNYEKNFWIKENGDNGVPTDWLKDTLILNLGDERAFIFNLGFNAHTQSDIMVYLEKRKMLFGGDVILNKQVPAMFSKFKADHNGYLKAFALVTRRFEIKTIVPGHGEIGGLEIINADRDYINEIKAAALDPSKKDEIKKKYKDWRQVPFIMSPGANISYVKGL